MKGYEEEVNRGLQQLPEYQAFYQHAVETLLHLINEWEDKKAAAKKELETCNIDLAKIDFMPCEYFDLAENMVHLLKSGRADTYKEALNIAINQEAQRKHDEEMERIAREEARERARAQEERRRQEEKAEADRLWTAYKADRDQRAAQDKAEQERKNIGWSKCRNCINHSKCLPEHIARGDGYNCAAYRPR
jgi:hypothetical protein